MSDALTMTSQAVPAPSLWATEATMARPSPAPSALLRGRLAAAGAARARLLLLPPLLVHTALLALLCLFVAHVQIVTRMVASSSPLWYWAMARVALRQRTLASSLLLGWAAVYACVGTVLFALFLPWT